MKKTLSILILEDNQSDVELMLYELKKTGFDFHYSVVVTEKEYRKALSENINIILADYQLPNFDAPAALTILKESSLDIPFIVISGSVRDETGVEMIKNGATDYLLKDRLSRLGIAVRNSLDQHALKLHLRKTEKHYRTLIDGTRDAIFSLSPDGVFLSLNKAFEEMTGWMASEWIGKNFLTLIHPDERMIAKEKFIQGIAGVNIPSTEYRIATSSNVYIYVEVLTTYLKVKNKIEMVIGIARDTTERKKAEKQLAELFKYNETIIDHSPIGIITYNEAGDVKTANDAVINMIGGTREALMKQNFRKMDSWKKSNLLKKAEESLRTHQEQIFESHLTTSFGRELWISCRFVPFEFESEQHLLAHFIDITDQKRAEETLVETEQRLRMVVNNAPITIFATDAHGIFTLHEGKGLGRVGMKPGDNVGASGFALFGSLPFALQDGTIISGEEALRRVLSGKTMLGRTELNGIFFDNQISPIFDKQEKITGTVAVAIDVTDRKEAEDALRQSEERFRSIYESSPIGIVNVDPEGIFIRANPAAQKIFGYSEHELGTLHFSNITLPEDKEIGLQELHSLRNGEKNNVEIEKRYVHKNGNIFWGHLTISAVRNKEGKLLYTVTIIEDISDRKQFEEKQKNLETQLSQVQKMEAIGTLAGGIAHDFNNILGIMMAHVSFLPRISQDQEKHAQSVDVIMKAIQRGASLVKQMLTFARKNEVQFESIKLKEIVDELLPLLNETFPKMIVIETSFKDDTPEVIADKTQIHQIVLNLCVNARDAMIPQGGKLSIEIRHLSGEEIRKDRPDAKFDDYVDLSVADTGSGIDKEIQMRIFDPFFTTKELGKGTGLGLSTVYGIVERHHGLIAVESEIGKGTKFHIYLPAKLSDANTIDKTTIADSVEIGGTETILIVEDEESLREMVKMLLEINGYTVLSAANGREGLDVFRSNKETIELIITDHGLPELSGDMMVKEIKEINPHVPVIVTSGFLEPDLRSSLFSFGIYDIIQKPFEMSEILQKIRFALKG